MYMLRCSDDSLYTGWTNDIYKRIKAHNSGKGAKYTRARLPVTLVYLEIYESSIDAQKREYQIKKSLSREEKIKLIQCLEQGYRCEMENEKIYLVSKTEKLLLK